MEQVYLQKTQLEELISKVYLHSLNDLVERAICEYQLDLVKYETDGGITYQIEKPEDMNSDTFEDNIIDLNLDYMHGNPLGSFTMELVHGQNYMETLSSDYSQIENDDQKVLDRLVSREVLSRKEDGNYDLTPSGKLEIKKDKELRDYLSDVPGVVPETKKGKLSKTILGSLVLGSMVIAGCSGPEESVDYNDGIVNYSFQGELKDFRMGAYNDSVILEMESGNDFEFFHSVKFNGAELDVWAVHKALEDKCEPVDTLFDGHCTAKLGVEGDDLRSIDILKTAESDALSLWDIVGNVGMGGLYLAGGALAFDGAWSGFRNEAGPIYKNIIRGIKGLYTLLLP